jgi:hypothetical protein
VILSVMLGVFGAWLLIGIVQALWFWIAQWIEEVR